MQPARLPVSLAFLDLDYFKLVNDEHGHLVGSELLARVGERLQELSRKQDWCFRYGGDEFVILMPETGEKPRWRKPRAAPRADGDRIPDEERAEAARKRQRGRGHRPRRRQNRSRRHRRRRYAHVCGKGQRARRGAGRVRAIPAPSEISLSRLPQEKSARQTVKHIG